MNSEKIVAIATANAPAGIGILRISGTNLLSLAQIISHKEKIIPRTAIYCNFTNTQNEVIDCGLLLYFNAPHSFTGEDVIEIQGHGSPMALNMLLNYCLLLGCRLAQPGEFSRRAYLNHKIDLVQAESIIDLINAESEGAAKSAIKSLRGRFSEYIANINQQLIQLRMFVEASLDFPEEDIEFIQNAKIHDSLEKLRQDILKLLANTKQGVILNNGANIVIIGRPNVGKSSLLNALTNEDSAIVTDIAGTTRDTVKEKIIINGVAFNIIDTAGIHATHDVVEQLGIARTLNAITNAEICLVLIDDTQGVTLEDENILTHIPTSIPRIFVHNKIDLSGQQANVMQQENIPHVYLSAKQNTGLDQLRESILKLIGFDNNNNDVFIARTRHLHAMQQTVSHIESAFSNWHNLEILAEELRYSHNKLGEITGTFTADDLLGEIFSKFCIGK